MHGQHRMVFMCDTLKEKHSIAGPVDALNLYENFGTNGKILFSLSC